MKRLAALSAIGRDQPGIVAALSRVLFERGCNLEDSSMTRLQGDFAVLLLISLPGDLTAEDLGRSLEEACAPKGLTVQLRELASGEASLPSSPTLPYTLVVYGVDHPGIVYRVAQTAADHGVNITDLRTRMTRNKGTDLYSLIMEVEIGGGAAAGPFERALEGLKRELKVEISLHPADTDEL